MAIMAPLNNTISNSRTKRAPTCDEDTFLDRNMSMSAQVRQGRMKIHAAQHS